MERISGGLGGMRAAVAVLRPSPGFCFVAPYVAVYCSVAV